MQQVLDGNNLEARMKLVLTLIRPEVDQKKQSVEKRLSLTKKLRGMYPGAKNQQNEEEGPDEVEELKTKIDALELTEEAKKITTAELKKLK